jgi:CheY-like chemotaxis protein
MEMTGKILIADEDNLTLEFFDITLSKLGFKIIKARDGHEALEKVKLHSPDLLLIDSRLPKYTGIEVTQRIRKSKNFKEFRSLPIVMFSAMQDVQNKVVGLEMGVDDYITKPFNFTEVLARIRSILRHKSLSNQILIREKKLAFLESLNTNLVSFSRHIKKPLSNLYKDYTKIDTDKPVQVKKFFEKFDNQYKEMVAMLQALEEEIIQVEKKGINFSKTESSLDDLEKKINKHIASSKRVKQK